MRKRIVAIFMCVCIIFMLCGCAGKAQEKPGETVLQNVTTNESDTADAEVTTSENIVETTTAYIEPDGVPDSLVLSNASIPENATYEISHSYDADAHIDEVTLVLCDKVAFGSKTTIYTYTYQYDRGSDSWELLSENTDGNPSSAFEKNAFLNKATFKGKTNDYHGCTYSISVLDIDIENLTIKIQYKLKFKSDSVQDLSNTETLGLWYTNAGEGPCFTIPYRRSMVVRDQMHFMLSIDKGIQFAQ